MAHNLIQLAKGSSLPASFPAQLQAPSLLVGLPTSRLVKWTNARRERALSDTDMIGSSTAGRIRDLTLQPPPFWHDTNARTQRKTTGVAILLLLSALGMDCPAAESTEIQGSVSSAPPYPGSDSARHELTGIVFAKRALNLVSEIEGQVALISVPLGKRVHQDDVLIELASPWLAPDLEIAKADVALAKARLEKAILERALAFDRRDRRMKLTDTWSAEEQTAVQLKAEMAEVDVVLARTQLDQQTAKLKHLAARLDKTIIRAPFGGVISARFVELGELVDKGQPLLRLITDTELGVRFGIPETLIGPLREGLALRAYFPIMGLSIEMSITHLAPEIDLSTGLATAEGVLIIPAELKGEILPGMTVRVRTKPYR